MATPVHCESKIQVLLNSRIDVQSMRNKYKYVSIAMLSRLCDACLQCC